MILSENLEKMETALNHFNRIPVVAKSYREKVTLPTLWEFKVVDQAVLPCGEGGSIP